MQDELKQETREQLAALCRSLVRSHGLPGDSYDELYTHLEDKILAYLHGEEALTEEDALILAREHFGIPVAMRPLLGPVPQAVVESPLSKLIGIAVSGSLVVYACQHTAAYFALNASFSPGLADGIRPILYASQYLFACVAGLLALAFFWCVCIAERARLQKNKTPRLLRVPSLVVVFFGFAAIGLSMWCIAQQNRLLRDATEIGNQVAFGELVNHAYINELFTVFRILIYGVPILLPILWFWWSDNGNKGYKRLAQVLVLFLLFQLLLTAASTLALATSDSVFHEVEGSDTLTTLVLKTFAAWANKFPYVIIAAVIYVLMRLAAVPARKLSPYAPDVR